MRVAIHRYPETFDRVDRIKTEVTHQPLLPGDEDLWILGSPLFAEVDDGELIEVPRGFTTDGASVPGFAQVLTGWQKWDIPQRYPAIVHDWLYTKPGVRKSHADRVFAALLDSEGANWWQRHAMYWAVVVGGGWAYKIDQREGPHIYS